MNDLIVFLGPSYPLRSAQALLDAEYRPPAGQGDLLRAALEGPRAIALVDGYFESQPAPWHKEILWALSRGVHVFGAASLGALRAVETERFGMVGVGRVVEAFRAGLLQGDDEVVLRHGPAASGYLAVSVPLVDLRATLGAALGAEVLDRGGHDQLVAAMVALPFPERTWSRLTAVVVERFDAPSADRFITWLATGKRSQKADDVRELLGHLAAFRAADAAPFEARWRFRHTVAFDSLLQRVQSEERAPAGAERVSQSPRPARQRTPAEAVLDELRLTPTRYLRLRDRARLDDAVEGAVEGAPGATAVDESLVAHELLLWRDRHGLEAPAAVDAFLDRQGLDEASLRAQLESAARRRRHRLLRAPWVARRLIERLRLAGEYADLRARASAKDERLARAGFEQPSLQDLAARVGASDATEAGLWRWWRERQAIPWLDPDSTHDVTRPEADRLAAALDLESADALRRLLLRERLYRELAATEATSREPPPGTK